MNSQSHPEKSLPQTKSAPLYPLTTAPNSLPSDLGQYTAEKHKDVLDYLKNIPAERKNRLAEITQWQTERKGFNQKQEETQAKLALYNEQIKHLKFEIETEKKAKERSRALIANLAEANGLTLPTPQPTVTASAQVDAQRDPRLNKQPSTPGKDSKSESSPSHSSSQKRKHEGTSNSEPNKLLRQRDDKDISERHRFSQQQTLPLAQHPFQTLSSTQKHAISIEYLEEIMKEIQLFQSEKQQWGTEKESLIKQEQQLQVDVGQAQTQVQQLQAELTSLHRSKAQTQALLASLVQSEGMYMQPNFTMAGSHGTLFAGNFSSTGTTANGQTSAQSSQSMSYNGKQK